jgi:hypothetical protein
MKFIRVIWDVAPCSHVEVDRRFRGAYFLHHRPDQGWANFFVCGPNEKSKMSGGPT